MNDDNHDQSSSTDSGLAALMALFSGLHAVYTHLTPQPPCEVGSVSSSSNRENGVTEPRSG